MQIPPEPIVLKPQDIAITSVSRNTSLLVMIQRDSEADKIITAYLESARNLPKGSPSPPIPPMSALGVGAMAIPDTAFMVLIKMGQEGKSGPNDTEFGLLKLIHSHGRKTKREAAL